jgi:hypothetical protein
LIVLAAVAGGSNLGMSLPDKRTVAALLERKNLSLDAAVAVLWGHYAESDEMFETFQTECRWWLNNRQNFNKGKSKTCERDYIKRVWPDIANVMSL